MLRYWASTTYFCQLVEAVLTLCIVGIALSAPHCGTKWFGRVENAVKGLAQRPWTTTIGIVAAVIATRFLLLPFIPIPNPAIHDEFSYLLAAKTFAAGRLTNVTDPFWRHFESVHIIQKPTYMSMYPPGQGLALSAGILGTGTAWAGVVVSVGLLAGALFWALSGWFPGSWALAATLLAAVRWLLFSYWMNSYWGGGLSALGGTLMFGSVPRLARAARVRDGLTFGCGLILLASTRPYEGLVFSVTLLVILIAWSRRGGTLRRLYRPALIGPLAAMLAVATAATLHFNARVTRDAFTLPYMEDRKEYAIAPLFVWGHMRPEPRYATQSLREVYVAEAERYQMTRTDLGIPELVRKSKNFWIFFLGPLLSVPFIAFWCARTKKNTQDEGIKLRYVRTIFVVMLAATAQAVWFYPHYFAPAFAPFVAVLLLGLRELRGWRWRRQPTGLFLSRAIPLGCLLMASIPASAHRLGWHLSFWPLQWALGTPAEIQGQRIKSALLADGKKALVFVEYGTKHDPGFEWIYNDPNIPDSQIIWARRVNPESDAALIKRFRSRSIWVLRPDVHPEALIRIPLGN